MPSEIPTISIDRRGKLLPEKYAEFLEMVDHDATGFELGEKFGLRERTALNWKKRLLKARAEKENGPAT